MRVLITGGSGFIGKALVVRLLERGHRVMTLQRSSVGSVRVGVEVVVASLERPDTYREALVHFAPEAVCHLAWEGIPDFSIELCRKNLLMSTALFQEVMQLPGCRKVLGAGSCWEYGKTSGLAREDEPGVAGSAFTWAKLAIRDFGLMQAAAAGKCFGWFRIFYAFGPGQRSEALLPTVLRDVAGGRAVRIKNPDAVQDFIGLEDVVEGFVRGVEADWPSGVFNLGTGKLAKVGDVVRLAQELHRGETGAAVVERGDSSGLRACTTRSEQYLDWRARLTLNEGVKQMITQTCTEIGQGECETIDRCRISDSQAVKVVLDFGLQPLANALVQSSDQPEEVFPLRLGFCEESSLVQLLETVPKEKLFRNYVWVSGTAETTRHYAKIFFQRAMKALGQPLQAKILEIASNDGTFLKPFRTAGHQVLGIDPAENIARMAATDGIPTWGMFWNCAVAAQVLQQVGPVDLVFARNVVPHVSELHEVIQGMHEVLAENGLGMIEFHEAGKILQELHYDSVYHEHLCYFSLHSMQHLLRRHGLVAFDVEYSPISGGSIVVHFSKQPRATTPAYDAQLARENEQGINQLSVWQNFAERCREHRRQSLELLSTAGTSRIVGFGASARSATYLNFCGITKEQVCAVIDNNPMKQGLFAPGSQVPIVSMADGLALKPDVIFILAWNFAEEIMRDCRRQGFAGKFLHPFPGVPRLVA